MMTFRIFRRTLVVPIATLMGCGGANEKLASGPIVDTLPSGVMSVDNAPLVARLDSSPWVLTESLRIGTVEGGSAEEFGEIAAFAVDAQGGIFILDRQAQEIRHFSHEGEYVRTIATRGEGPGEIAMAAGLMWDSIGRLWVWDPGNMRYTAFDADGAYVTSHRRSVGGVVYPWLGRFVDGRLIDISPEMMGATPGFLGSHYRFHFIRLSADFQTQDSLPPLESQLHLIGRQVPQPFSPRLTFTLSPDGTIWFAINTEYRFYQRTFEGDTVRVVSLPRPPIPVSPVERDSVLDLFRRMRVDVTPEEIPETKPSVQRMIVDELGDLIVFPVVERERQGTVFDVFDPSGEYLGRVTNPAALEQMPPPRFRDGFMYGVTKDKLDVEYLVRFEVRR